MTDATVRDLEETLGIPLIWGPVSSAHAVAVRFTDTRETEATRTRLTEREAAVASLVVQGRTNDAIAVELRLSTRTVEWNLTKVYRTLGVRSRTELAIKAASGEISWAGQQLESPEIGERGENR